ncbi:hypothetical protein [Pseudobutyrivibrio sp. LB2011]|nr:hypothetical protein [Pseudobutyrivibrio sp. LB2011]
MDSKNKGILFKPAIKGVMGKWHILTIKPMSQFKMKKYNNLEGE